MVILVKESSDSTVGDTHFEERRVHGRVTRWQLYKSKIEVQSHSPREEDFQLLLQSQVWSKVPIIVVVGNKRMC